MTAVTSIDLERPPLHGRPGRRAFNMRTTMAAASALRLAVLSFAGCDVGLTAPNLDLPSEVPEAAVILDGGTDVQPGSAPAADASLGLDAGAPATMSGDLHSPLCNLSQTGVGCDPDQPACLYDATDAGGVCTNGALCEEEGGPPVLAAACRVVVGADAGASCSTAFTAGPNAPCTTTADCNVGYECVAGGASANLGICMHYCCDGASSCTDLNSFCDIETVFHGINLVPVCASGDACVPFGSCSQTAAGETCTLVNEATGQTACVTPGPATVGSPCTTEKCAANLACISQVCQQLCKLSQPQCAPNQTCIASSLFGAYLDVGLCSDGA